MNQLKITVFILVIAVVGLGLHVYFEREKVVALQSQIQVLNARLDVDAALSRVQSLEMEHQNAVAEFRELVQTKITPQVVAATLVSRDESYQFAGIVANQLWDKRHADVVSHPKLIASAAAEVYEKYGKNLRGDPGVSASAEEIAKVLASEPGFADLVIQLRDHYNGN